MPLKEGVHVCIIKETNYVLSSLPLELTVAESLKEIRKINVESPDSVGSLQGGSDKLVTVERSSYSVSEGPRHVPSNAFGRSSGHLSVHCIRR